MPSSLSAVEPWRRAAPAEAGFAPDLAEKFAAGQRSGLLRDLHAVLVCRAGALALEYYGVGPDKSWARSHGVVTFGPEVLHDVRSVTKSIVGLLYGIALHRGQVPPPTAALLPLFPAYPDLIADPQRAKLTVGHALTMTMGLEWDEQRPYSDPANSEIAMERAPDRLRFALDRPVLRAPGGQWTYSGGAVALLGALIVQGAGQALPDFAREVLFEPLGIETFEWMAGRDGVASAASGLRLRPGDLLRIGMLVLARGVWQGRQIVPAAWLDASFTAAVPTGDGLDYGYLWYLGAVGTRRWLAGFGNGGQRLYVMPDAELAAVMFSGAYDKPDSWMTPARVWREIVVANLEQG